jgi:hypothetical protein
VNRLGERKIESVGWAELSSAGRFRHDLDPSCRDLRVRTGHGSNRESWRERRQGAVHAENVIRRRHGAIRSAFAMRRTSNRVEYRIVPLVIS